MNILSKNIDYNFHVLKDPTIFKKVFENIIPNNYIIELGCGTGSITNYVLSFNPKVMVGYEIQPNLCLVKSSNFTLIEQDVLLADFAPYENKYILVAAPPYNILEFIIDNILPLFPKAILMTSPKYLNKLKQLEFKEIAQYSGEIFSPISQGTHHIVARGI